MRVHGHASLRNAALPRTRIQVTHIETLRDVVSMAHIKISCLTAGLYLGIAIVGSQCASAMVGDPGDYSAAGDIPREGASRGESSWIKLAQETAAAKSGDDGGSTGSPRVKPREDVARPKRPRAESKTETAFDPPVPTRRK